MPILTVKTETGERHIPFNAGRSLREILDNTDVRVRSGCRGLGICGLCRVRIETGEAGNPTLNEQVNLDNDELDQGIRLACQVLPRQDLHISILAPAPKSNWRSLPYEAGDQIRLSPALPRKDLPRNVTTPYGVAVDLGTTHIRLSLYELTSGKWLAGRYGLNPQARYGSDIVTRLVAASESPEQAHDMSRQVVTAIGEALFDITVATASEEMSATSGDIAQRANQAAEHGAAVVEKSIAVMQRIAERVQSSAITVEALGNTDQDAKTVHDCLPKTRLF